MTTPVKYIGRKSSYTDHVHGSKLTFTPGQTRDIPDDSLGAKFLRQIDIFERGSADAADTKPTKPAELLKDDTASLLDKSQKEKDALLEKEHRRNELVNHIRSMDKEQLSVLANDRWGQSLHNRLTLENARVKVLQFVDLYGVE